MTDEPRTAKIDIDGRRYAWRSIGAGPPLILLNGYSATAQDWDPTLLGGLASSFEVLCPDHRGMGGSELGEPSAVTVDSMAADVERLMDAVGLESGPIAGWSMGGFVAQRVAIRSPQRVDALVLMGTDPGGSAAVRATPEVWARLTDHSGTPREQASRLIPLLFPSAMVPAIDEAFGDLIASARAELSLAALEGQQHAMAQWHADEQPAPVPDVALRTLVMAGNDDIVIPPANAELLALRWPSSEIEMFAGAHAFFALEPQRAAERIVAFLRD